MAWRRGVVGTGTLWLCAAAFFLVILGLPAARVLAHGEAPTVFGVVSADAQGPNMVRLNEGLALRGESGWSFLCPSLWGDLARTTTSVPLALSLDGTTSWLAGEDDLYTVVDGSFTPQARPELSDADVVALVGNTRRVFALRNGLDGSEVWSLRGAGGQGAGAGTDAPIWTSETHWESLAVRGSRLTLARMAGELQFELLSIDEAGAELERRMLALDTPALAVTLRAVLAAEAAAGGTDGAGAGAGDDASAPPGMLYAQIEDASGFVLFAITDAGLQLELRSPVTIHGPQFGPEGGLWVASEGTLYRRDAGASASALLAVAEHPAIQCLGRWGDYAYVCLDASLHALSAEGIGPAIYELAHLAPPLAAHVPDTVSEDCSFQWQLFANDLARNKLEPGSAIAEPEPDAEPDAGMGTSEVTGLSDSEHDNGTEKDGGVLGDGAAQASPPSTGGAPAADRSAGGCGVMQGARRPGGPGHSAWPALLVLLVWRRRRERASARARTSPD